MKEPLDLPVLVDEDGIEHHVCPDCNHRMRVGGGRVYYQCPVCAPHRDHACPNCGGKNRSTDGTLRCQHCKAHLIVEDGTAFLL